MSAVMDKSDQECWYEK